ncbi:MAG: methyltransferase domain-containing protein [Bacteroidetes bacterium]|nr:methyltransferase domain-containing protein [Bacteroidota bacterium]
MLDATDIAPADLYRNLDELHIINKQLGGYAVTRSGLRKILSSTGSVNNILDIGFGGGHAISQMREFADSNKVKLFFYGVDNKNECLSYAERHLSGMENKQLICDDFRNVPARLLEKTDVIHCSLFLHHLNNQEIISLFKFAREKRCIILANDLHRHWLAFYSIKVLTSLFSKSILVKNDAPLSVKRGFKKRELVHLLKEAGFTNFSVKWCWAFRYRIIAKE